jgi:hypothetical protein
MEDIKKNMWNAAGTAGLALGAVSSAYLLAGQVLSGDMAPAVLWQQIIAFALWSVKFVGCIWLMKFFMTKFAKDNEGVDNKSVFRMGALTALLSALMFSGISLANMLYISADYYDTLYQTVAQQMSAALDSNSLSVLDKVIENMPQIIFFYNLSYCFLFGTALSAILSRNIPARDPFADYKPDEQ